MKKTLVTASLLAAGVISSLAQGTIDANPAGASGIYVTVTNAAINGGAAYKIGTPATTAGFPSTLGPGQVTFNLYAAPSGTSLSSLLASTPIATTNSFASQSALGQGTFSIDAGSVYLTTQAAYNSSTGGRIVAGWDGTSALEFIFTATTVGGGYFGQSSEVTGVTAATGAALVPYLFGTGAGQISSFVLAPVPEPTTLALGGLGAASLLLFRRRK